MDGTRVKICGLSTDAGVAAALEGGAAFVGFVFFARSPRHVEPEAAARLARPARQRPTPLAPLITAAEQEAHAAFIAKELGEKALWNNG